MLKLCGYGKGEGKTFPNIKEKRIGFNANYNINKFNYNNRFN